MQAGLAAGALKSPAQFALVVIGLFIVLRAVECREDAQVLVIALEQSGLALFAELQPDAVEFAAHRSAVAGQARGRSARCRVGL